MPLHNTAGTPRYAVRVVLGSRVEPRLELHLFVADVTNVEVGLDGVGMPALVAKKLEVDLVVAVPSGTSLRRHCVCRYGEGEHDQLST